MTTSIVYVGPAREPVEIADTGQLAEPGEPIDVDTDVAKQLLEQGTWERAKTAAKRGEGSDA